MSRWFFVFLTFGCLYAVPRSAAATRDPAPFDVEQIDTCHDGIDNNFDGKEDYEDFNCFGPNQIEDDTRQDGWSRFYPSVDSRIIYVSTTDGDDDFDGLSPTGLGGGRGPVRTIAKAHEKIRDGYPDWVLLKRGDVFVNQNFMHGTSAWNISGRSPRDLHLISSYGRATERPRVFPKVGELGLDYSTGRDSYFAVVGIHLEAQTRGSHASGIALAANPNGGSEHVQFEDLYLKGFLDNLSVSGFRNVSIRRSVIVDSSDICDADYCGDKGQGIYADAVSNLLVEDNVLDNNGYLNPSVRSHNIYVQKDVDGFIFRNNISTRASSHGISTNSTHTQIVNNVFAANAVSIFARSSFLAIDGNIVVEGKDIRTPDAPVGWGILVGHAWDGYPSGRTIIENNIIANKQKEAVGLNAAIQIAGSNDISHRTEITVANNIVADWRGSSLFIGKTRGTGGADITPDPYDLVTVSNNIFHHSKLTSATYLIEYEPRNYQAQSFIFWSNQYSLPSNTAHPFSINAGDVSRSTWMNTAQDTSSVYRHAMFRDATRSTATYAEMIGLADKGDGDLETLVSSLRRRSKTYYPHMLKAEPIADYFREGYRSRVTETR